MKGKRTLVDAQYLTSRAVIDWSEHQGERKKHQTHKPRSHYWQRQAKNNILCALIFICFSAAGHLSLDKRFIHSLFCDIEIGGCERRKKATRSRRPGERLSSFEPRESIRFPHAPPLAGDVLFIIPHAGARSFLICCDTHHQELLCAAEKAAATTICWKNRGSWRAALYAP